MRSEAETRGDPTPEAPPEIAGPTSAAAPAIAEAPIAAHPVAGGAIGEATDPWSAEVPPELAALRARIESPSVTLAPIDIQRVGSYSRHHPADARALLLLGHGAVRMRWMTEALTRYREAFELDPASRGDPRLLENLVVLAQSPAVGDTAAELLAAIYGAGAIDAIDRALAAPELDRGAASRLREARALAAR